MTVMVTLAQKERGALNVLLLPLIGAGLLFLLAVGFGVYAFSGMEDYKNNSDQKSAAAVEIATKKEATKNAAEYAKADKKPLKSYNGPAAYGSLVVQYPKTWSAYVVEQQSDGNSVDAYFNPNYVPSVTAQSSSFALRARVISQSYASVLQTYQGVIKSQKLTATPYAFPKVPSVTGTKLVGQIATNKQGTMVIVPLRANTLEVWTESSTAQNDFDTSVLPNLSFSP